MQKLAWCNRSENQEDCEICNKLKKQLEQDFFKYGIEIIFYESDMEDSLFFPSCKIDDTIFYLFYDSILVDNIARNI